MTRFLSIAILFTLFSCGSSLDDRMESLVNGKNLWQSRIGSSDYSFELQKNCFCSHNGQTIRISIEDGEVTRVAIAHNGTDQESGISEFRPTMRELFELVLELNERELASEGTVKVQYDETLGFPTSISWQGNAMDDSIVLKIGDVATDRHGQI